MGIKKGFQVVVFLSGVFLAGGVVTAYFFLRAHVQTPAFRAFAEEKVGALLRSKVKIEKIRVRFFKQVLLSGIKIQQEKPEGGSYQIRVDQLIFRYNFWQILTRNFSLPAAVIMQDPRLNFDMPQAAYDFFKSFNGPAGAGRGVSIRLQGGEMSFMVPGVHSPLILKNIKGAMEPDESGNVHVDFHAFSEGFISGSVRVLGDIDPVRKTHRLELGLEGVRIGGNALTIPLEAMKGTVRWENDSVYLDKISAKFHGWESKFEGKIARLSGDPLVSLKCGVGKRETDAHLSLKADFSTRQLTGNLHLWDGDDHIFRGEIKREGLHLVVSQLHVDEQYQGGMRLQLESGDASLELKKENQRIFVQSNLQNLHFRLQLQLDHVKIFGLDLVTFAVIRLAPVTLPLKKPQWEFSGDFETQYFVLGYTPFDDFHGHFEMNPLGIKNITGAWGRVFRLNGDVSFLSRSAKGKFEVSVDQFDLKEVRQFAAKPLPKDFGGILEGKLRIEGPLARPEVFGNFNLKDGWFGKLRYDCGIIRFHGFPPYIPLQDSSILKGRTNLYLKGAIDLSLPNIFQGVELQTTDKIVLWKSLEINSSLNERDFEIQQKFLKLPTMVLKAGAEKGDTSSQDKQGDPEDRYVALGPKIKF